MHFSEKSFRKTIDNVGDSVRVKQDGKEVIADVKVGETSCRKVVLKESKNQYGTYYRFVSASEYELKVEAEPKKAEKKSSGKLRTKTEQLCGARRQEIISFAEKTISKVADGSAPSEKPLPEHKSHLQEKCENETDKKPRRYAVSWVFLSHYCLKMKE